MQWCVSCGGGSGGWGRREFLRVLGQACLAVALGPGLARAQTIMDETSDVKIGREADPEILKQFGYYDGPDIQNYVAQVGRRVVSRAHARFSFEFKVVDQTYVNAMALPGGFIYVSRGMLAELNEEAQLAGILGHEITHVNSRHGVKLMTKALIAQGLTLAGVVGAAAGGSGSAASGIAMISNHITNYMLLGYGREFEVEADEVGLRHAHRAGYDPRRLVSFFRHLRRMEILRGQTLYHGFEATHPDTAMRIAKVDTMANLLTAEGGALEIRADQYKAQLERLRYGEAKDQLRIKVYTVKPGDTLASIAQEEMGDEGRRFELASLNGLPDGGALTPGSRLKLIVKQTEADRALELRLKR
jgi:predicted Zn-dependent protease